MLSYDYYILNNSNVGDDCSQLFGFIVEFIGNIVLFCDKSDNYRDAIVQKFVEDLLFFIGLIQD